MELLILTIVAALILGTAILHDWHVDKQRAMHACPICPHTTRGKNAMLTHVMDTHISNLNPIP